MVVAARVRVRVSFEEEVIANRVKAEIVGGGIVVVDGRRSGGVAAHRNLIVLLRLARRRVSESVGTLTVAVTEQGGM